MNKKGFTLIELLAVIVILAVIALIATPVIMNAISNAKQGAWKDAAYGIIKATENTFAKGFSETTDPVDTFFLYENGVMTSYPSGKTIDYKGSVPQDGGIVLHADGSITLAIHDGSNCAVKTKSATTVTVSTTDKATCISNIYYKQASAPFTNLVTNGDFSNGTTGWNINASVTLKNGYISLVNATAGSDFAYRNIGVINSTNLIYLCGTVLSMNSTIGYEIHLGGKPQNTRTNEIGLVSWVTDALSSNGNFTMSINNGDSISVTNFIAVNLTSVYGAGNEPTVSQMDNNLNKVWIDTTTNTPKRFTADGWINF